ncbi:hypothetical protein ACHAW5_009707 [Stephanodiscus triporus]|uniref:Sulfotransferase domain-containing protein n=1 Tax=Stephanodiscus triporus TaxID=2934178 RepID=A0ABD3N276_9STRA
MVITKKQVIAVVVATLWCVLTFKTMNKVPLTFWTKMKNRFIVGTNFEASGTAKFTLSPETPGSKSDADDSYVATQKNKKKNKSREGGKKKVVGVPTDDDCLRARNDTVPPSLYRNLPTPYLNLAFPKMGTTTLHHYFDCGGLVSSHFRCSKEVGLCANCIKRSVEAGQPALSQCGEVDVYAQMDDGKYFPQIEMLDELSRGYPNATFFLIFRSMKKWYHSITHWPPRKNPPHLSDRFKMFNITGAPTSNGARHSRHNAKEMEEFSDWYCNHVKRVRTMVQNSSHTLVEIDLEDPGVGQRMEDLFGIPAQCWRHSNVNIDIHPELSRSGVSVSRAQKKKKSDLRQHYSHDMAEEAVAESHAGEMGEGRMEFERREEG